jgi:hypothetical protein
LSVAADWYCEDTGLKSGGQLDLFDLLDSGEDDRDRLLDELLLLLLMLLLLLDISI